MDSEELLRFDIAFALKKVTIPGFRKALTEDDPTKGICARRTERGDLLSRRHGTVRGAVSACTSRPPWGLAGHFPS